MIDSRHSKVQAILYSPVPPTNEQRKNLIHYAEEAKAILQHDNVSFIEGNFTQLEFKNYDHF